MDAFGWIVETVHATSQTSMNNSIDEGNEVIKPRPRQRSENIKNQKNGAHVIISLYLINNKPSSGSSMNGYATIRSNAVSNERALSPWYCTPFGMIKVPLPSSFRSGRWKCFHCKNWTSGKKIKKSVIGVNAVQLIAFLLLFSSLYSFCTDFLPPRLCYAIWYNTLAAHFPDSEAWSVVSTL